MSKDKYDFSKVPRERLEALARVSVRAEVHDTDRDWSEFHGVLKNVRDQARIKPKHEVAIELLDMLGTSAYAPPSGGQVTFNVKGGTQRVLELIIAYSTAPEE